jgi:hypothetical protein
MARFFEPDTVITVSTIDIGRAVPITLHQEVQRAHCSHLAAAAEKSP